MIWLTNLDSDKRDKKYHFVSNLVFFSSDLSCFIDKSHGLPLQLQKLHPIEINGNKEGVKHHFHTFFVVNYYITTLLFPLISVSINVIVKVVFSYLSHLYAFSMSNISGAINLLSACSTLSHSWQKKTITNNKITKLTYKLFSERWITTSLIQKTEFLSHNFTILMLASKNE